ncbi:MAG: hypothetical protein A3K67_02785 [Euryarchaeota archaeon RBG_16_62_10]|nr:MAG: hypothetical protein A3K67_02785 [Euryarchaeota archaeon RBG_16_62_10]
MGVVIRKMKVEDLVDVKGVDLLAWTDLMERSYGLKAKLAPRTDESILSYLHSDPEGAFVAYDEFAGAIGSCFSHVWGRTGWVGPLSVLPSYQARGLGKELLKRSLQYLEDQGCVDIGLETMPENATNLGMYLKVGLRPEGLVLVLGKKLERLELEEEPSDGVTVERLSESSVQPHIMSQVKRISSAVRLGLDYSKEVELAQEYSFGDTIVATSKGKVVGFCVVHTVARRTNMPVASVKALVIDPASKADALPPLVSSAELLAADAKVPEMSIAMPAISRRAVDIAFSRGYSVLQTFERLMYIGSSGMSDRLVNLSSWSG